MMLATILGGSYYRPNTSLGAAYLRWPHSERTEQSYTFPDPPHVIVRQIDVSKQT